MKNILLALLLASITSASAHMIEGTQVLKGSLKTKLEINFVETTCKVKIEKVKNLMIEDSYGNPAYKIRVDINLAGNDYQRRVTIRFDKEVWMNNLFVNGSNTEVKDFEYASDDGSKMFITRDGRVKTVSFLYNNRLVSCNF